MKFGTMIKIDVVILLIGIIVICLGIFCQFDTDGKILNIEKNTFQGIFISIGCSIIAAVIISTITTCYISSDKESRNVIENWGIKNIEIRATINTEINEKIEKMKSGMDITAFGMKNFISRKGTLLVEKVKEGKVIRILTLDPDSQFVKQREKDEHETEGQIRKTILDMISWAEDTNSKGGNGKIMVKTYNSLPLDMYQSIDGHVYIGPYLYGKPSQQTVTYSFKTNSKGSLYYKKHFEELWNNENLTKAVVA